MAVMARLAELLQRIVRPARYTREQRRRAQPPHNPAAGPQPGYPPPQPHAPYRTGPTQPLPPNLVRPQLPIDQAPAGAPQPPAAPRPPAYPPQPPQPPAPQRLPADPWRPHYHPAAQPPAAPQVYRIPAPPLSRRRWLRHPACLPLALAGMLLLAVTLVYLLFPGRVTMLLIGVDYIEDASMVGRSDTLMLAQVEPLQPRISLLSIPRDLWVNIPGQGDDRINTAHFYAESRQPGSGPLALRRTVAQDFGVDAPYYLRIRFEGFREIVDAMGGVDITLTEAAAGYEPGSYHLTGRKALAFVRSRAYSDDFHRMGQGQFMLRAMFKSLLNPLRWWRLPGMLKAAAHAIDTNLPAWQWPRLALALLRLGPSGIDSRIINRDMTSAYLTPQGAQVLLPDWQQIHALVGQLFK